MDKKEFGKRLKNVRIRNKMSQQAMADSLGYTSRSTINKIEEGINEMSYDKIVRLMELYGLSRPDLGLEPICGDKLSGLRNDAKYPNPEIEEKRYAISKTAFQIRILLLVIIHIMRTKKVRTFLKSM